MIIADLFIYAGDNYGVQKYSHSSASIPEFENIVKLYKFMKNIWLVLVLSVDCKLLYC